MQAFRIHLTSCWIYKYEEHTGIWDFEMIEHLGKGMLEFELPLQILRVAESAFEADVCW